MIYLLLFYFMCMGVSPEFMSIHHVQRPEESVGLPGSEVTDVCEWPCGHWALNTGPPGEKPVLLATEPSLYH